ncbi:MAG: CHAD domain-containing protein [Solirubrobacteraceae bacterium]
MTEGSVSYQLEPGEAVATGLRRCAGEQLDSTIRELTEGLRTEPVKAVHGARKSLKKERSLLRLGRGALDTDQRRIEMSTFRDAGRKLGGARDADVMIQALDDVAERYVGQVPQATFAALRERLGLQREAARVALVDSPATREVVEELKAARLRIENWSPRRGGWPAISGGLLRSYRRGRKAFERARAQPTSENLHDWRKRAKDLWYHLRLLEAMAPLTMHAHAGEAHRLSDLLGDDHDLSVLAAAVGGVAGEVPADVDPVLGLIDHRRDELQREAFFLGRRLYAEKPKAFMRRVKRYWRAWRAGTKAARSHQPTELAQVTRSAAAC